MQYHHHLPCQLQADESDSDKNQKMEDAAAATVQFYREAICISADSIIAFVSVPEDWL